MEEDYGVVLELLKRAGHIAEYKHHPAAVPLWGNTKWTPDFWIQNPDGAEFYVEVKGFVTDVFKLKLRWYKDHAGDYLPLFIVKCSTRKRSLLFHVTDEINTEGLPRPLVKE